MWQALHLLSISITFVYSFTIKNNTIFSILFIHLSITPYFIIIPYIYEKTWKYLAM
jgi:hypothetical protein